MKKLILGLCIVSTLAFSGCNGVAKQFGGTTQLNLPQGQKLVNVTWKDNQLWYLSKKMTDSDKAENYKFQEKSDLGILQGTVNIQESK